MRKAILGCLVFTLAGSRLGQTLSRRQIETLVNPYPSKTVMIAVATVFPYFGFAQNTTTASDSIADENSRADALFQRLSKSTPGCSIGVIHAGDVLYKHAYGMANVELSVSLNTDSVFGIDSMSKQFTAMSIMLLASRGRLSLNDDIRKYIPEFPDYGHTVTVQ